MKQSTWQITDALSVDMTLSSRVEKEDLDYRELPALEISSEAIEIIAADTDTMANG